MAATIVPAVLNRRNYDSWSSRVKSYLVANGLWGVVEGTHDQSGDWRSMNDSALHAIQISCGDEMFKYIKDETRADKAWELLKPSRPGYDRYSRRQVTIDSRPIRQAMEEERTIGIHGRELAMEEGRTGGHGESNANNICKTFIKYVESKDWDNAIKFLGEHPGLGSARTSSNGTALHKAVQPFNKCSVPNIEQLVELMKREDLEIQDSKGYTALYYLVEERPERVEVAKRMIAKNDKLLTILPNQQSLVVRAERQEEGERMARYLYSLTPRETLSVTNGAHLISLGFRLKRFDIAWELIQYYPQLAGTSDFIGNLPLATLASNRLAFLSGCRLNLWEKLIYYGIRIKPLPPTSESDQSELRPISNQKENRRHLFFSVMGLYRGLLTNLQKLLGINRVYEMKLMHERVQQFLPLMCKAKKTRGEIVPLQAALRIAVERGHVEYITHFCINELNDESYPIHVEQIENEKHQSLFQIAAECRHHKVYNLIHVFYELLRDQYGPNRSDRPQSIMGRTDYYRNNMLHTVASITSFSQIDHIRGAALQMQRELQWFKEVESVTDPNDCESINDDYMTPREVFTESHKAMGKEAEKSMKEIATSCTVVGSLIITMMFAAAFTVPGGNDEKTGLPTFLTKNIFIVSDAISLFSSTTSVIMFLGILTSRYFEDDFLKSLPTKMIIGLFALFLSIVTMMIVFSCTLYIMLDRKSTIVIPSILLASVPVASFIWMQFPLFVELFISTFGQGIFDRKQKNLF
ncbi:hypothetical protein D8674_036008 [Pyrus ussuriensis x Pyrus communis]|uniref:PGG domain-containing protein n=1 Tax=Pyrus ussuriensis x Pyrus communis TaxID=2448454 RepID=A0A5N5GJF4_9ROSA|nr:hypothetical protein D8674_036008 [Pyrus ussuriensis x Pyrus communis]